MQGSLAELKGSPDTILVASRDEARAQAVLATQRDVRSATRTPDGLLITLRPGLELTVEDAAADINRRLVEAGLTVHRLDVTRASLEERFLEITSRLGATA
jgi:hypothetical protein